MATADNVKTRFLILSDTHGMTFDADYTLPRADVAIHCGDLTAGSQLEEFRGAIHLLKEIDAPLKLVIAGNHDFALDIPFFQRKMAYITRFVDADLVNKAYGDEGQVRQLFEEESQTTSSGLVFLDEGTHRFTLDNGASLTVHASPWTPSFGDWAFQYHPERGHDFAIGETVDVVMTHGPPSGILDGTESGQSADLFRAVARARPRLHCFGHIHEGWGAKLVAWQDNNEVSETESPSPSPSHVADIDSGRSIVMEKLANLKESQLDTPETVDSKSRKREQFARRRCYPTSHCSGDENPVSHGRQTLFVNASIMGDEDYPVQLPWLVDIELRKAELV